MRLSATVMAHPVREDQVTELVASLDRDVPVQWDQEGPPSSDPERRWRNGRAAWERIDRTADWGMVIQDDALVCADLLAGLEKALDHVPGRCIVQPFVGTKRPNVAQVRQRVEHAEEIGAAWIDMRSLCWGVAIIVPTMTIGPMLSWCDAQRGVSYDKRIGVYYRDRMGWRTRYPWPSLVDHRQGSSICGHDSGGRMAHRMHQGSALDIDWSGPVADLAQSPREAERRKLRRLPPAQRRRAIQQRRR